MRQNVHIILKIQQDKTRLHNILWGRSAEALSNLLHYPPMREAPVRGVMYVRVNRPQLIFHIMCVIIQDEQPVDVDAINGQLIRINA